MGLLDDSFKEVHLIHLTEASILHVLMETLALHIEAVFLDQTIASLSRHGQNENPGQISSDGTSGVPADPLLSWMQ